MTDRHRGVTIEQHEGYGLAQYRASAHHYRAPALACNSIMVDYFHDSRRRCAAVLVDPEVLGSVLGAPFLGKGHEDEYNNGYERPVSQGLTGSRAGHGLVLSERIPPPQDSLQGGPGWFPGYA